MVQNFLNQGYTTFGPITKPIPNPEKKFFFNYLKQAIPTRTGVYLFWINPQIPICCVFYGFSFILPSEQLHKLLPDTQ
jgi:hypothetical protein